VSQLSQLSSNTRPDEAVFATKDPSLQWFAAYTTPRHEKHVAELLAERTVETFLPLYQTVRQRRKSCPIVLELPLFPCHLFVRIRRSGRRTVLGLPGVLSIVGSPKDRGLCPVSKLKLYGSVLGWVRSSRIHT
jgi:transcription antitermination factor NusG